MVVYCGLLILNVIVCDFVLSMDSVSIDQANLCFICFMLRRLVEVGIRCIMMPLCKHSGGIHLWYLKNTSNKLNDIVLNECNSCLCAFFRIVSSVWCAFSSSSWTYSWPCMLLSLLIEYRSHFTMPLCFSNLTAISTKYCMINSDEDQENTHPATLPPKLQL